MSILKTLCVSFFILGCSESPADKEDVADCGECGADQTCVNYVYMAGPVYRCFDTPSDCDASPSCDCLGETACTGQYDSCTEHEDRISCECPSC